MKALETVDRNAHYDLKDAVNMIKENASAKFDETVEIAINLGVDLLYGALDPRIRYR